MTSRHGAVALISATLLSACASAPKDAGFGDVSRVVTERTGQPPRWDAEAPVRDPDDRDVLPLLQEELTADRAVQIAFAHNRDLQATLEELGVARADLLAATRIRNPLFHIEARFPGDPKIPIEFGVAQTLVDLLNRGSRKRAGEARFERARNQVAAAVVNFAAEVRSDHVDLVAARRILVRHGTIREAQEAATLLAKRQHDAGNITDLDLENAQVSYEGVKLEHARLELAELQARERLFRDLGLLQPAELRLPDDIPPLPATEMTGAQLDAQILARRLDVVIARSEVEEAAAAAGVARTAFLDETSLGGHFEREPDGAKTLGPELQIPIPLFDRGSADRQRAHARWRQAQQRYAALAVNARSQGREALFRLGEARSRLAYLHDVSVPRRERIVQLTLTRYNAMLASTFDLLQARQELASAERDEILAARDYWRARTELETTLAGVSSFTVERAGGEARRPDLSLRPTRPEAKEH